MDWSWATSGVTNETPRTMGPECENYMTNRRRWIEAVLFNILFVCVIKWAMKRLEPIHIPDAKELEKPHSTIRLILLIIMTLIFGIEMGFKLANRSVIFVLNPCHIQTLVQIYLLAAKPSKLTVTLFRIQMNNLNGPFLAFIFPEVECRTLPFEQAAYWIQHAMLYIIPVYILRSGAYQAEDLKDFNWAIIGVEVQLIYHFGVLNFFSIYTGINLNHMLCAAESDPFQGDNYRIAAVIHESILCPILNKVTVLIFGTPESIQRYATKTNKKSLDKLNNQQQQQHSKLTTSHQQHQTRISETPTFYPMEASTSQLIHRKIAPIDYQQQQHLEQQYHQQHQHLEQQHHHQQHHHQQHHHQQHHEEPHEAVYQGDYIPEQNDMEIIEVIKPTIITAECTIPTTKID